MSATKAKTLNGKPTSVAQLNVGSSVPKVGNTGPWARLVRLSNKINLVLAGMYTGVTCYGVPRDEQSFEEES